jgi:hypothetical protein
MTTSPAQRTAIRRLKASAIVCLGLLLLLIVSQLLSIYQTKRQLTSPLIPRSLIDNINQQYLFQAVVSSVMLFISVGLFLLRRYWWAILLVAITLVGNRFLYW